MKPARIEGVLSPVITPFKRDLSPDADRFVKHCRWLMKSGCAGLAAAAPQCAFAPGFGHSGH